MALLTLDPATQETLSHLETPLWVFDIERDAMVWANRSAVALWNAASLADLVERDFTDMSPATRARLRGYLAGFARDERVVERWTFYPYGRTQVVDCRCSGIWLPTGRLAMLVEGKVVPPAEIEAQSLRMIEALRHTPTMVSLYTPEGVAALRNPAATAVHGPVVPHGLSLPAMLGAVTWAALRAALARGEAYGAEVALVTAAGPRTHGLEARQVSDPVTGAAMILVNENDVSRRQAADQALRESEARFRTLHESLPVGVVMHGTDGRILMSNAAAAAILGLPHEDLLGWDSDDAHWRAIREDGSPFPGHEHPAQQALATGEPLREVIMGLYRDTGTTWLSINCTPLAREDGEAPYAVLCSFSDVTDLKKAEDALKRSNADLQQFAYVASHDLREPLRTISSYLQLLARRYAACLDEEGRTFLDFAVDGAQRMDALIQDLLQYSRVENQGEPFQIVSADQALDEALDNLALVREETGATVTREALPWVHADRYHLIRLFQNLIDNALKFRRPGVSPRVHVRGVAEGPVITVSVTDNGIGIDPALAGRIFTIFQRLHGRGDYPGTGIGLAVCKRIVERSGGRIWVESTPGEGATFHFTLPLAPGN